jgi:thioredoxin-dependent peroxiredoxin
MATTPEIGKHAPDFTLPGLLLSGEGADAVAERSDFTLSEHRGKPIVLAFYPGDNTPVCTKQMCAYSSEMDRFKDIGADVWGLSPQDLDSHETFARRHGLNFPLLADTGRDVIRQYGISLPGLGLKRSVFLVDAEGILRWKHVARLGLTYQPVATLTSQLASLS